MDQENQLGSIMEIGCYTKRKLGSVACHKSVDELFEDEQEQKIWIIGLAESLGQAMSPFLTKLLMVLYL